MRILSRREYLNTPAGIGAQRELRLMVNSSFYDTNGSYNHQVGTGTVFMQRHLNYLIKHPNVSPEAYISNLRIMTKIKR